jgi:hypothetical protein
MGGNKELIIGNTAFPDAIVAFSLYSITTFGLDLSLNFDRRLLKI